MYHCFQEKLSLPELYWMIHHLNSINGSQLLTKESSSPQHAFQGLSQFFFFFLKKLWQIQDGTQT